MVFSTSESLFLEAVRAAIHSQKVQWTNPIPHEDWAALMELARKHQVLPLVYEAVFHCPAAQNEPLLAMYKGAVINQVTLQTFGAGAFLSLYEGLRSAGFHPLVVKGIVCRSLYPQGDFRPSGDEDLYVPPEEFDACCRFLLEYGMTGSGLENSDAYECSWRKPDSNLHVELHRYLFPPESAAYGELQRFFSNAFDAPAEYPSGFGSSIFSLSPHDHLLFLILHAYKHFVHAGFGIRQVCDIGLWTEKYAHQIDWPRLRSQCREAHALGFALAVLGICRQYLGIEPDLPDDWRNPAAPCEPMLKDLLAGGIYGSGDANRLHASNITVETVQAQRQNRPSSHHATLFPPADALRSRYPILIRHPYLLPAVWCLRIVKYLRELIFSKKRSSASDTMRIASERIELLKLYDII